MSKRLSRITSIFSISLLTAAMFSVSSATSTAIAESPVAPKPVAVVEYPDLQAKSAKVGRVNLPREYRAAFSKDAKDKYGYEESLYRGKYYYSDQENFRMCVMDRESNFSYVAANSTSSARGAYQFLDNAWRDGLVHMMLKESRKHEHGLGEKLQTLFDKPIHQWNRYFQDRAFFTALNYSGKWSGKKHWNATVPGTSCSHSVSYRSAAKPNKKMSAEYKAAHSKAAKDLYGYEQSLYRGKYYNAGQEPWRKCVMARESDFNYDLIGAGYNHPYHGAYQFHNINWRPGLVIMMAKESKETKDGLNGPARELKHKNLNQWNRYWQDRAFFTALNYNGLWSGKHHWAGGRWYC
jgi:hypothetical protein